MVVSSQVAGVGPGEDDVGIVGPGRDVAALAAADGVEVVASWAVLAGDGDGAVVLLGAEHTVGEAVVGDDVIELGGRLIVLARPCLPAVKADVGPAVVAVDYPLVVLGRDPEVVIVAVRNADGGEGPSAVGRLVEPHVEHVDGVRVLGIGVDVCVVPRPLAQRAIVVGACPALSGVVGAKDAAVVGLDDGPDAVAASGRRGDVDLALDAVGQPVGEFLPGVAAVGRFVQTAVLAAAAEAPRGSADLPHGGIDDARVERIESDVDGSCAIADVQDSLPRLAAVGRSIETALGVWAEHMSERGDIDQVGVVWMDGDAPDLAGVAQTDVGPGLSGVDGPIHAVAMREVAPHVRPTHADVDNV